MSTTADDPQAELVRTLYDDRVLAHQVLFRHRRPNATPEFHKILIQRWHDPVLKRYLGMAFRGSAKSTLAEEAMILRAGFREFRNGLIIGENFERANERLYAIKREIESNELLLEVFGDLRGPVWGDGEIVLSNGCRMLAMGRGQAIRGIKFEDIRPDAVFLDDLENKESVRTPEQRHKTKVWYKTELGPALDPSAFIRMAATPLDPEALAVDLSRDPEWVCDVFPIEYPDENGKMQPTWADRFGPMEIDREKRSFERLGLMREYRMEFMCTAEAAEDRNFKQEMFRIEPTVRSWQAVYAFFDPARTTNAKSATTGYAAWSYIANRIVIWDSWAKQLMPDEIVSAVFECDRLYKPTIIGVEEDGLNEFLMQPLRHEQLRRSTTIPVRPYKAPKGKLDFIRGLQPFFNAREVWFTQDFPDLRQQLLSFPTGRIDAPNALAYALKMRPGAPMYDDFGGQHVAENLQPAPGRPVWLCLNATRGLVTGVLAQFIEGSVRIYADYVREGEPSAVLADVVAAANLDAGRAVKLICGPAHSDKYTNVGLRQAIGKLPMAVNNGVQPEVGRPHVRSLLQRESRSMPMLMISSEARWTTNAFAGGYCRTMLKQGMLADYAEEGQYRVLMEGFESFAGLLVTGSPDEDDHDRNYGVTHNGRRYLSALARN